MTKKSHASLIVLTLWNIWKERNKMIFQHLGQVPTGLLSIIKEEAEVWTLSEATKLQTCIHSVGDGRKGTAVERAGKDHLWLMERGVRVLKKSNRTGLGVLRALFFSFFFLCFFLSFLLFVPDYFFFFYL